jgi:hypothetical protein
LKAARSGAFLAASVIQKVGKCRILAALINSSCAEGLRHSGSQLI